MLADGIMVITQDSPLSWMTLIYAPPRELVEKRPAYLTLFAEHHDASSKIRPSA